MSRRETVGIAVFFVVYVRVLVTVCLLVCFRVETLAHALLLQLGLAFSEALCPKRDNCGTYLLGEYILRSLAMLAIIVALNFNITVRGSLGAGAGAGRALTRPFLWVPSPTLAASPHSIARLIVDAVYTSVVHPAAAVPVRAVSPFRCVPVCRRPVTCPLPRISPAPPSCFSP